MAELKYLVYIFVAIFLISGIYMMVITQYAYMIILYSLAFAVLIFQRIVTPGPGAKKYWFIGLILLFLIIISILNPQIVEAIIKFLIRA